MNLYPYKYSVENKQGDRISGATVFFVPYLVGRNSKPSASEALVVYTDPNGISSTQLFTSDSNGEIFAHLEPGNYSVCVDKNGKQYFDPYICIQDKSEPEEVVFQEQEHSQSININPEFKFIINHNLDIEGNPDICIEDSNGEQIYPDCQVIDQNTICIEYSDDCPVSIHTVTVKTLKEESQMSGGSSVSGSFNVDSFVKSLMQQNQYLIECLKDSGFGGQSQPIKFNGVLVEEDEDGCINITYNDNDVVPQFPNIPLFDDDGNPVTPANKLPTIKVNGVEGIYDPEQNCLNFSVDIPPRLSVIDGGSGLVNANEDGTEVSIGPLISCDNESIDAQGAMIQTCARVPVCGYTGDKICEDASVDNVGGNESQSAISFSAGPLAGMFILTQSGPGGVMAVGTPTVSGSIVSVPATLSSNAKVGYNVLVDKNSLPSVDGCSSPISGLIEIDGLTGSEGGSQITKAVGGVVVTETNLVAVQGNVYETVNNQASMWRDEVGPHLFGGDPANLVGSTETGEVQVFDGSTQNVVFRFEVCRYLPAVAYETLDGEFLEGVDSDGNAIDESEFQSLV